MRTRLLTWVVLLASWSLSANAQQTDLNSAVKIIVTSGAGDRNELASELVVMLYEVAPDQTSTSIGAATIIGMNRDCLYLATADHVVRDTEGKTRALSARSRWSAGDPTPVKVLPAHDAVADLGVVCLAQPERLLVPFPRIPFFVLGDPSTLVRGDAMTFFGEGDTIDWHTKSEAMTYATTTGDVLVVHGGGIKQGDSGGALFRQGEGFTELVGMISGTSGGETKALSLDRVTQRLRDWGLPVNLERWNYREANVVINNQIDEGILQVGMESPPTIDRDIEPLKRLAVHVSGGPSGRVTGLLIGATDSAVWVRVPWNVPTPGGPPRLQFSTGFEVAATYVADGSNSNESVLTATVPPRELTALGITPTHGFFVIGAVRTLAPLRVPTIESKDLTTGTTAFLIGVDSDGMWRVSPRNLRIEDRAGGKISLTGGAVDPLTVGWLAFDDRNRLIGTARGFHNESLDLAQIRDLEHAAFLPVGAKRLKNWRPLNLPLQIRAGGADARCLIARAIGYARNEEVDDITPAPGGLLVAGRTHMLDFRETEDFTLRLDRSFNISEVRRSQVPGQKGTQRLVSTADATHTFSLEQVLVPAAETDPSSEPNWCGFVEEVDSTGPPILSLPVRFCGTSTRFLPEIALGATNESVIFGAGKADGDHIVKAVAVAKVSMDGSVQEVFEDNDSVFLGGASRGADGTTYTVGYGANAPNAKIDLRPVFVSRIGADGRTTWHVTQTDQRSQKVRGIAAMADGSTILVGYASLSSDPDAQALRIWKMASDGTLEWKRDLNLGTKTEVYDVISNGSGAVVAGEVYWPDGKDQFDQDKVNEDGWILAINGDGTLAWQQTYSAKYDLHHRITRFRRILRTSDGYVALGEFLAPALNGSVMLLVQLQADGLPRQTASCTE